MSEKTPAVSCPYCGSPMLAGRGEVEGDILGFLLAGFSIQHLWFRSDARKIKEKIVASSTETPAHWCERCGAMAIPPAKTLSERIDGAFNRASRYREERKNR